jgi:hypothetical protein
VDTVSVHTVEQWNQANDEIFYGKDAELTGGPAQRPFSPHHPGTSPSGPCGKPQAPRSITSGLTG